MGIGYNNAVGWARVLKIFMSFRQNIRVSQWYRERDERGRGKGIENRASDLPTALQVAVAAVNQTAISFHFKPIKTSQDHVTQKSKSGLR